MSKMLVMEPKIDAILQKHMFVNVRSRGELLKGQ